MQMTLVSPTLACSSVLLAKFSIYNNVSKELAFFWTCRDIYNAWQSSDNGVYKNIQKFAHVTASTINGQNDIEAVLEALDFVRHGPEFNSKNGTNCSFWYLSADDFYVNFTKLWAEEQEKEKKRKEDRLNPGNW